MTRTLDSQQDEFAVRNPLRTVNIVRLITYTDRETRAGATNFYFSDRSIRYPYGGGSEKAIWPVLKSIGVLSGGIVHVPAQGTGDLVRKPLEIVLSNEEFEGEYLCNTLRDSHTIENASVEIAQLMLKEHGSPLLDLSSLDGDEHTVWYRGRVARIVSVTTTEIRLRCELDLPKMRWLKATDATKTSPKDLGRRLPIVFGQAKRVPAIAYEVGWATTLAEAIDEDHTGNTEFTNVSGISGSGNTIKIGNEEVTATYVDDQTLNITARAQNSTTAITHRRGEVALEMISNIYFVVAGHEVSAIDDIYLRNPNSGELVRVPSGEYIATVSDTSLISGETVASVKFTAAQLRTVLEELFGDAEFSSDPVVEVFRPSARVVLTTSDTSFYYTEISNVGTSPLLVGGVSTRRYVRSWFPVGSIPDNTREVIRYRLFIEGNVESTESRSIRGYFYEVDLPGTPGACEINAYNNVVYGDRGVSSWATPPANTTLDEFETDSPGSGEPRFVIKFELGSPYTPVPQTDEWVEAVSWGIEVELDVPGSVSLAGSIVGFDLELYADVDGIKAPSADYEAGAGNLIESMPDVARYWIAGLQGTSDIGCTVLTSDDDSADQTSYTTASIAPSGDVTILAAVLNVVDTTPNTPTLSGNGLTWTQVGSVLFDSVGGTQARVTLFRASGSSPSSGVVTIDFSSQTQAHIAWGVFEFEDTDTTTTDGVVQSATNSDASASSLTVTLSTFDDPSNGAFGVFAHTGIENTTPGSGFDEKVEHNITDVINYAHSMMCEWKSSADTSVDASAGATVAWGGIAVELARIAPSGATMSVDETSFGDAETNLSGNVVAFDARSLGTTWENVLSRMGYEFTATFVPDETSSGTVWKMLTALRGSPKYDWPSASGEITKWNDFTEECADVQEGQIATRFTCRYAYDASLGITEEAYKGFLQCNDDTNDLDSAYITDAEIAAAVAAYGPIEADLFFLCIQDETTAKNIFGYHVHERIRAPKLWAVGGATWWEALTAEVGDIMSITEPWKDSTSKMRVIDYAKDPATERIEIRGVEVE